MAYMFAWARTILSFLVQCNKMHIETSISRYGKPIKVLRIEIYD